MHRDKWKQVGELVVMNMEGGEQPCIVFVNRIGIAIHLASYMSGLLDLQVPAVYEGVPLEERQQLAERMRRRDKGVPVVVATSIWATGLDIPALAAVYNCGVKRAVISLMQQAGRGERIAGGKSGFVLYDISFGDKDAVHRLDVYREAGYEVEGIVDCRGAELMQKALDSPVATRPQQAPAGGAPSCATFSPILWILIIGLIVGTCIGAPQ